MRRKRKYPSKNTRESDPELSTHSRRDLPAMECPEQEWQAGFLSPAALSASHSLTSSFTLERFVKAAGKSSR